MPLIDLPSDHPAMLAGDDSPTIYRLASDHIREAKFNLSRIQEQTRTASSAATLDAINDLAQRAYNHLNAADLQLQADAYPDRTRR
jgi:hypothetical protein